MKKKLSVFLCLVLSFALSVTVLVTANASNSYDGQENYATDGSLWNRGAFATAANTVIDENGIQFVNYGAGQACAGISLKELLPYNNTVSMVFNSESATGLGFLKVVFADCSGSANGAALKPWEISERVEHLAIEIKKDRVNVWQYNKGNEYGTHVQQSIENGTANYIDGQNHTLTITSAPTEKNIYVKIAVDGTVHLESTIESTKLNCNSVLTVGAYGTANVSDKLTVSSLTIKKDKEDPAQEKDMENILFETENWVVNSVVENGEITIGEDGVMTLQNFGAGAYGATYANVLPSAYRLSAKLEMQLPDPEPAGDQKKGVRFVLLDNECAPDGSAINTAEGPDRLFVQIDTDGNVWIKGVENGEEVTYGGDWVPNLKSGVNNIYITVTPVWEGGYGSIEISVQAGGKTIFKDFENLDFVNGNRLTIGGFNDLTANAVWKVSALKIHDLNALQPADMAQDATAWTHIAAQFGDDGISLPAPGYLATAKSLPLEGELGFTLNANETNGGFSTWLRIILATFQADGNNGDYADGKAGLCITLHPDFYTMDLYNGSTSATKITKATGDVTTLMGKPQQFKFVTEKTADGLKLTIYRNDKKEVEQLFENGSIFAEAQGLYLVSRSTGGTGVAVFSEVTSTSATDVQIKELKNKIFALTAKVTEENVNEIKQSIAALNAELNGLDGDLAAQVNNYEYLIYVEEKADAVLAAMADKEAAQSVIDMIAAIEVPEVVTEENAEALKEALQQAKSAYEALTSAQQEYVTNVSVLENCEVLLSEYELVQADKAAAKTVEEQISAIVVPESITAENVEELKAALESAENAYNALSEQQKSYVSNYSKLSDAKQAVENYENSLTSGSDISGSVSEGTVDCGDCGGSMGVSSVLAFGLLSLVAVLKKKRS